MIAAFLLVFIAELFVADQLKCVMLVEVNKMNVILTLQLVLVYWLSLLGRPIIVMVTVFTSYV